MGWRRLIPSEIMCLEVGTFFLLTVSQSKSRSDPEAANSRKAFIDRLVTAVICSKRDELPNNGRAIKERALDYLLENNGFIRNGAMCIEVACILKHCPHRHDYIGEMLSQADVQNHLLKGGGLDLTVLDYPSRGKTSAILLKWMEIPALQLFISVAIANNQM
jgi:hypothetical protein